MAGQQDPNYSYYPDIKMDEEAGVLKIHFSAGLHIDNNIASRVKDIKQQLIGNTVRPVMIDLSFTRSFDRDARSRFSSTEFLQNFSAGAIVIQTRSHKLYAESFLYINKPGIQFRIFDNQFEALNWLKTFIHFGRN